ncbi:unnamed protein product [Caenorhabditis sp. 36 PRJEB53466]|nr:unnamed protein product [Caenorhabditis sp. 36 PRJEB53466]
MCKSNEGKLVVRNTTQLHIVCAIADEIRPYVRNKTATLVIDFGCHVHNYMCAFISFVCSANGTPSLRIVPYAFSLMYEVKTAENVKALLLVACLNRSARIVTDEYLSLDISELDLKACLLTPGLKRMSRLQDEHRQKAIDCVKEQLAAMKLDGFDHATQVPENRNSSRKFLIFVFSVTPPPSTQSGKYRVARRSHQKIWNVVVIRATSASSGRKGKQ